MDHGIALENKAGERKELTCDRVLISIGDRPERELYEKLQGKVPELYNIGDSNKTDSFAASSSDGYYTALTL